MHKKEDSSLKDILDNLNEKTKELNCIYRLDELLNDFDSPFEDILKRSVEIIPTGWRYSDLCKVRIRCNGLDIYSPGFIKTDLAQSANITIENAIIGTIQICYIKPLRIEKGIFLFEESRLLKTIAEKIAKFIHYKDLRKSIDELKISNQQANAEVKTENNFQNWLQSLHLTDSEIETILKIQVDFKKGEAICKQGAISSYIMILKEGLTKNYLEGNQQKGFNFSFIKPFDFIALSSLYGENVYHFSGTAITPCRICLVERETFIQLVNNNQAFAEEIMKWYCRITASHLKRLSAISNKQALGKVADVLIYLSEKIFESNMIQSVISRKDMAELAGMSTESAVRVLSELKKDKIINIHHKGIEILNMKLLQTLSKVG
ncbi:MAG: Crp/Fnr family transcriptional regulator [Bacteroidetes bacterium]|nr:Crp/Fnr family transcriptional regulator [Bacteroidota bacterium]MBL6964717.1 Crp/Fnr family transcriptional regulator [Bacteroidota bacterium]